MMCRDREQRECGSADVEVWRSSDLLDPIKPKAVDAVLNQQLACHPLLNSLLCLSSITVFLNALWGIESLKRTPASICIPATDSITCQTNR